MTFWSTISTTISTTIVGLLAFGAWAGTKDFGAASAILLFGIFVRLEALVKMTQSKENA